MVMAFGGTCKTRSGMAYTCHRIPGWRHVKSKGGGNNMELSWECDVRRVGHQVQEEIDVIGTRNSKK